MFSGSYVALITPFKNGQVDERKLIDLVEWHIAEGTNGLVPVGTTGESATLSPKEHARVIEVVAKAAKKRVPVIAGTGSNSTQEAIELTTEAKEIGVDGALLVNPYYNRPTQEGLKAHFGAVAKAVGLPIVLYNIPSRTGVNLAPATIAALAKEHKNIIGVKESTGSMDQATEILQLLNHEFILLSGDDSLTLPLMAIGAKGVISVAANLVPKEIARLSASASAGKWDEARGLHTNLFPLIKALFLETNPAPVKAAMFEAGLIEDESLRLPMVTVTKETREKIRNVMKNYSIRVPARSK